MKTIFRTNPQKEFTVLANRMLRDRTLSFKARGMLAMVMTHSETWEVHASWIGEQGTEGREAITSGLTELESAGYVQYQQITDEGTGQFTGGMWTFSDSPCPESDRTNRTKWRQKQAEAAAKNGQEKAHGNRGNSPHQARDTASRSTAITTGSRDTGTPQDGFPSTKKKPDNQDQKKPDVVVRQNTDVLMEASPGDVIGWREIGLALLGAYNRPPTDIEPTRLSHDEQTGLSNADQKCTREELECLVRFIRKPADSNNPLLKSRAQKMSKVLLAFREQIGLAVQVCPPPRRAVPSAAPKPALQAEPVSSETTAENKRRMQLMKLKIKGGPDGAAAAAELEALEATRQPVEVH